VTIHYGTNNWQQPQDVPMKRLDENTWTVVVPVPHGANQVDFVFTNGEKWDNNSGADWHVRSCSSR
jgi:hypothetical protein